MNFSTPIRSAMRCQPSSVISLRAAHAAGRRSSTANARGGAFFQSVRKQVVRTCAPSLGAGGLAVPPRRTGRMPV